MTTAVAAAPAGFHVVPGVAAYGALEARRWTEQAAEAGCPAVMLLPPNAYRADAESVVAHYREVAKAGLPIVAYNNPIDTKVDLTPALLARLHGEGLIVAVKEFTGDVRRAYEIAELAPDLDVICGSDDVVLELADGRRAGLDRRHSQRAAGRVRGAVAGGPRRATWPPRCRPTGGCIRCCAGIPRPSSCRRSSSRWTSAGRYGGPCRPPRGPLIGRAGRGDPPRHRVRHAGRRDRGGLNDEDATSSARGGLAHRGHADAGDHRRGRRHPGRDDGRAAHATSSSTWTTCGPCSCTSRAGIRPCPAPSCSRRPGRTPTSGCCSSRSPAACRCVGTARSAWPRCSSRPAWCRCNTPVTTVRLDVPAGLVVVDVAVRDDGAATAVTIRNVPSFPVALDRR